VHLLEESTVVSLDATLTDDEVFMLIAGVNDVWAQADITWEIEAIVRERAQNGIDYARALVGEIPFSGSLIRSVLPTDRLLRGGCPLRWPPSWTPKVCAICGTPLRGSWRTSWGTPWACPTSHARR
jgi:hypothetical protein